MLDSFGGAVRTLEDGAIIFAEGDPGDEMYVVRAGKVRVFGERQGKETTLCVLDRSDFFGEMALLTNKPRSATAQAVGDVELLVIGKAQFDALVNEPLIRLMLERMSARIHDVDERLETLSAQDQIRREHLSELMSQRRWAV